MSIFDHMDAKILHPHQVREPNQPQSKKKSTWKKSKNLCMRACLVGAGYVCVLCSCCVFMCVCRARACACACVCVRVCACACVCVRVVYVCRMCVHTRLFVYKPC